jgi:uncharacterized membrane protein YcaP (DUF421 family)
MGGEREKNREKRVRRLRLTVMHVFHRVHMWHLPSFLFITLYGKRNFQSLSLQEIVQSMMAKIIIDC